jgi:hypothetical protein
VESWPTGAEPSPLGQAKSSRVLQELSLGGGSSRLAPDAAGVHVL